MIDSSNNYIKGYNYMEYRWICRFCKQSFRTRAQLNQHKKELEGDGIHFISRAWNKGLTKQTDKRVAQCANKLKGKPSKNKGKTLKEILGDEHYKKIRETWKQKRNMGGYRKGAGRGKKGWYKEFFCFSSYELAYVIYCLEHNIDIHQCKETFKYFWNNSWHKYLPDFITNGVYIEIKGYEIERDKYKQNQFPKDKKLKVLYYNDLQYMITYCKEKYGEHFISLYEDNHLNYTICKNCKKQFIKHDKNQNFCSRKCANTYDRNDMQQINKKVKLILQSNIDFTKFGWVNQVAKLINILPQRVHIFMKKYMLQFYNDNCFKRKSTKN